MSSNYEIVKTKVFSVIRDDKRKSRVSIVFNGIILALIIVNVILIFADTFTLSDAFRRVFNIVEIVSTVIFSVEYVLRVWTSDCLRPEMPKAKARIKYAVSITALIDLFAILPSFVALFVPLDLHMLRTVRTARLLRLVKVNRYTGSLTAIRDVFRKKASQLLSSMFVVALLMIITSVLMFDVESEAQPEKFRNAFSGLWWAIATLTTVGYGDIYPVTVAGKVLSGIIAFLGIGLVAVPTGIISAGFMERISVQGGEQTKVSQDQKSFCPYCGHKLD